MNTQLTKLFNQYNLSEKNRYEINQFFTLLPLDKQRNLIDNFELLSIRLIQIEKDIEIEKQILIPKEIENIKNVLEKVRKERINKESKWKIDFLKEGI